MARQGEYYQLVTVQMLVEEEMEEGIEGGECLCVFLFNSSFSNTKSGDIENFQECTARFFKMKSCFWFIKRYSWIEFNILVQNYS